VVVEEYNTVDDEEDEDFRTCIRIARVVVVCFKGRRDSSGRLRLCDGSTENAAEKLQVDNQRRGCKRVIVVVAAGFLLRA
jgi:hypothetical protein